MVMDVLLQTELSELSPTLLAGSSTSDRLPNVSHLAKGELKWQSLT